MNAVIDSFASGAGFGVAGGGVVFSLRWLMLFASSRADKREAQIDAGTSQLISQLNKQIEMLTARMVLAETYLKECREEHHKRDAEMSELRALVGKGAMQ